MEAVLIGGDGAVLSHISAAAHWGLLRWRPTAVDITVPRQIRPRPGMRIRRRALRGDETTNYEQIPITTVARTLFDLAAILDVHQLDRAFNEAEVLELTGESSVPDLMRRHPGAAGISKLREVLALGRTARTLSDLEDLLVGLIRRARLPFPELNACIDLSDGPIYVDALWREQRLVVEVDGSKFHRTTRRRREDRGRDRALAGLGFRVCRFNERELSSKGGEAIALIRSFLVP